MKTYVGIVRDHSGSMHSYKEAARKDYNAQINAVKEATIREGQDTIVSVVTFGGDGYLSTPKRAVVNSSIGALKPLTEYPVGGGTPLYGSIGELINLFESLPDAKEPGVAFLLLIFTDGDETGSPGWDALRLQRKISELQRTDRWTFTFRVPPGRGTRTQRDLGVHAGNILQWETTERGLEESTTRTQAATQTYYSARAVGATATKSFYNTDLSNISKASVKKALHDITAQVQTYDVAARDNRTQIKDFIERKTGHYQLGSAFYQLMKTEPKVHEGKMIAVRDRRTGKIFSGSEARRVLGLPEAGTIKVVPGNHGEFEVFVQSKSVNRNLVGGTKLLYWPNVGRV